MEVGFFGGSMGMLNGAYKRSIQVTLEQRFGVIFLS